MINLIIHGCNGKMGQVVAKMAAADPDIHIVAGIDKFPDTKKNDFPVYSIPAQCQESADIIIDFSVASALPSLLEWAVAGQIPVIIATTGLSEEDYTLIEKSSSSIPVFISSNMSLGVNLMSELVQKAAAVLGTEFDVEIIEKHHNQKIDAPSGTAYFLADAINEVFLNSKHYTYGRHSKIDKRANNEIGIHSVRAGTIVGEHNVIFAGRDEVLEVTHTAYSKQIFAAGALAAVKFLINRMPGLYTMKDMMTEQSSVTNISSCEEAMITINHLPSAPEAIAKIFEKLGEENIIIDMISQTAPFEGWINLSFTLPKKDLDKAVNQITMLKSSNPDIQLYIFEDAVKVTVEGAGMKHQPRVAAEVFKAMASQKVAIKAITTSETEISYIIDKTEEKRALEALINAFGL